MATRELAPSEHVQLVDAGVRKRHHADFDPAQADEIYGTLSKLVRSLVPRRCKA
jgi:uncharacterized metal-binding protein